MSDQIKIYCEDCDEWHAARLDDDGDTTASSGGEEAADEPLTDDDGEAGGGGDGGEEAADEPLTDDDAGGSGEGGDGEADTGGATGGDGGDGASEGGEADDADGSGDGGEAGASGAGKGGSTGTPADPDEWLDEEAIQEAAEAAEERREAGKSGDAWNASGDYHAADEQDERRVEQVEKRKEELESESPFDDYEIDIEDDMYRRQREYYGRDGGELCGESLRAELRSEGLIRETTELFRQIKDKDDARPGRSGSSINRRARVKVSQGLRKARNRQYEREVDSVEAADRVVGWGGDMSGSMDVIGERFAKMSCGLLAAATDAIGDDFTAAAFSARQERCLIKAVDEPFRWDMLDVCEYGGGTPMRQILPFLDAHMAESDNRKRVMFVCCDGGPRKPNTVKDRVEELRERGTEVIGVGMGPQIDAHTVKQMFGGNSLRNTEGENYILVNDFRDLPEQLVRAYRNTLDSV